MHLRSRAKSLRQNMTPEEVKLWVQLRELNKQGYHFRRQAPVDGYILDFAEFSHRLIIEVDGSQHSMPEGEARDVRRDRHFSAAGFRVLRFWNIHINREMNGVMVTILEALSNSPSGATRRLPREGGEGSK